MTVELKNDLAIRGTLHSVDQYLNIKLENTRVVDQDKYPHMVFSFSFQFFYAFVLVCSRVSTFLCLWLICMPSSG